MSSKHESGGRQNGSAACIFTTVGIHRKNLSQCPTPPLPAPYPHPTRTLPAPYPHPTRTLPTPYLHPTHTLPTTTTRRCAQCPGNLPPLRGHALSTLLHVGLKRKRVYGREVLFPVYEQTHTSVKHSCFKNKHASMARRYTLSVFVYAYKSNHEWNLVHSNRSIFMS